MSDPLQTYLHDHLTAAEFAVELTKAWRGDSDHPAEFRRFAEDLEKEISNDRSILQEIVETIGRDKNSLKHAAGWFADKMTRYKLSSGSDKALSRFEGLEVISLGILGKLALWDTLRSVPKIRDQLERFDLEALSKLACDQHRRVEAKRIEAAQEAFA